MQKDSQFFASLMFEGSTLEDPMIDHIKNSLFTPNLEQQYRQILKPEISENF